MLDRNRTSLVRCSRIRVALDRKKRIQLVLHSVLSRPACDTDTAVVVYDVRTKQLLRRIPHHNGDAQVDTVALSDDGRMLAIGADDILLVDL
jgi:hypothetical protein